MDFVPVVDLSPFRGGGACERAAVARAVDEACRALGFMQIVGHGIEPQVIEAMRSESERFFQRPYDALIQCIPTEHSPKYPPVIAGEHLINKILGPRALTVSQATNTAADRIRT